METSSSYLKSIQSKTNKKQNDADSSRYQQAAIRFQLNHKKSQQEKKIDQILEKANESSILVPRPGEFLVVSSRAESHNPSQNQNKNKDSPFNVQSSSQLIAPPLFSARRSVTRLQETPIKVEKLLKQSASANTLHNVPPAQPQISLEQMQKQLLKDSNMHTNLTTNIRDIMNTQNTQLLTQSTRLLSSQKKRALPKETQQIMKRVPSNLSTHSVEQNNQLFNIKPSASVNILPSQSLPKMQRPGSALLLNEGDETNRHQLSQKLDLKSARFKNQLLKKSHSYKALGQRSQRIFRPEAHKITIPPIVRLQRELIKQKRTISPFMVSEDKILTPSPSLPQLSTLNTELEQQSTFKLLTQLDKEPNQSLQLTQLDQKQYFPLEAYDPIYGQEQFQDLVEKFKDIASGITLGKSRWQVNENQTEFRPCQILSYIPSEGLFLIKWLSNGKTKKVARFNIIFDKENPEQLEERIKQAEELRRVGQLMHQYIMLCQDTDVSLKSQQSNIKNQKNVNPQCSDDSKTRISYLVSSFDSYNLNIQHRTFKNPIQLFQRTATQRYDIQFFKRWEWIKSNPSAEIVKRICDTLQKRNLSFSLLSQLFVELDQNYLQVHKQILFDSKLPYCDGRYDDIAEVLPPQKFQPIQERKLVNQNVIVIPKRSSQFEHLVQHMSTKLHFAHTNRLKILLLSNHHNQLLADSDIFQMKYSQPVSIEKLIEINKRSSYSVIKLLKNQKFDMEYEIQKLVTVAVQENTELNNRLKAEMTYNQHEYVNTPLSQTFIDDTRQLQKVLQMRFEQAQRQNYIDSTNRFIGKLESIIKNLSDSTQKNLLVEELNDQDVMQITRDSILETRITQSGVFVLQSRLRFNEGQIKIEPPVEKWLDAFMQILQAFENESVNMPCFDAEEYILGPVYADLQTHIFQPDEQIQSRQSSKIKSLLQEILKVLIALVQAASKFQELLNTDLSEFKKYHKKNDFAVDFYKQLLDKGIETTKLAETLFFEPTLKLGPFHVDCQKLKGLVLKKIVDLDNVMCDCIKRKIAKNNKQIEDEVEGVLAIIKHQTVYRDIEHVTETKQYIQNLPNKMLEIRALIKDAMSKMTLLEKYQRSLTQEEMANTWYSISKPLSIFEAQGDCMELLEIFSDRFAGDLNVMRATLADEVRGIESEFETVTRYESLQLYERAVSKCDQIYDRLDSAIQTSQVVNRREKLYNQPPTDYSKIQELKRNFLPLNSLWNFARDYYYKINLWMNGPLSDIDRDKMPNEITIACRGLLKLAKQDLRQVAGMSINIANELRNLYLELKPYLPIISALKNPDLQTRHWEIINKTKDGIYIDPDMHQSISDLLKIKVLDVMEDIATVSDIASKERQLEVQLAKMRQEWQSVKFELHEYAGTVTLGGVQHIWDMLDEQIQKTMVIAGSPYVKYLIQDVLFWKQQLVKMQEILEEWSKVQRGWLYLFPIFSSADIQEQLEDVYQMFQSVDKMWRVIMLSTQNNPQVVEACNQLKLLENLTQCNTTMERVQKSLNQYLHDKRLLFPRFFFLSNDDLLQILSQTKDPTRVQDHLNKCFEGIYKLKFSGQGNQIQVDGMYSQLDEYITFNKPVQPFFKKKRDYEVKPVEEWLLEVEKQMRESLRREMKEASESFAAMQERISI